MKKKGIAILLTLIMMIGLVGTTAAAAPATVGAPEHFAASLYVGEQIVFTLSAPDDMRTYIEEGTMPAYTKIQVDYKMDDGDWHYSSDWDTAGITLKNTLGVSFVKGENYISSGRTGLSGLFPEDSALLQDLKDRGWSWDYFKLHSLSFRVRFVASADNGKTYTIYSDWSDTSVLADGVMADPDKLINHAPTLTSATVERNSGGQPFLKIRTGRLPGEVQDLNAMSGTAVWTEVYIRTAEDDEFKLLPASRFSNEYILIGVDDYFDKTLTDYSAVSYEIKTRYKLDLRSYIQTGRSDIIYSPFSNVFSQNMPAWSEASPWATEELQAAADAGLIPDILKGKDMTSPITREEFAELAVLLYEKTTGKTSTPTSPNPFTDTTNQQILKAFALGITKGTSATEFSPAWLITREQCATMLYRDLKAIAPQADFSIVGVADFADQKYISAYAVEATKFMSKIGIVKGDAQGRFMPKANTSKEIAAQYGMATREQAILMSVRIYNAYK